MKINELYKNSTCTNLPKILKQFDILKGQFIIAHDKVERLVGIGSDHEDWYYLTYNGKKLSWRTCVGRIIPLKTYLRDEDYDELVRISKLNDHDFTIGEDHIKELYNLTGEDHIVIGLYLTL